MAQSLTMEFGMEVRSHGVIGLVLRRACPPTSMSMPGSTHSNNSLQAGGARSYAAALLANDGDYKGNKMIGRNKDKKMDANEAERKVKWIQERPNVWRVVYADEK
jgi:hypothetical protein